MIQAILSFQFDLNQNSDGDIDPKFNPIQLIFQNKKFNIESYDELITLNDIFGIFYQHTAGISNLTEKFTNLLTANLKDTPFKVISFFKQHNENTQFIVISIFEIDDDIDLFEEQIKAMNLKLEPLFLEHIGSHKELYDDFYMSWDNIKELSDNGFEIGSHGVVHSTLIVMTEDEIENEILLSKTVIEKYTNKQVRSFSVPLSYSNNIIIQNR